MPYLFAFTLILNIAALGYFIFAHESVSGESPQVVQAKNAITKVVDVSAAND